MAQMFAPSDPYTIEAQRNARARKLAEMLQTQGTTPIDPNRMAGGWVVPIGKGEGLSKIAQALAGSYGANRADEREREAGERQRGERTATMEAFANALKGTPGRAAVEMPPEEAGGGPGRAAVAPVAGNPMTAYGELMKSQDPSLQQMGMKGIVDSSKPMVLGRSLVTPGGQTLAVDQTWQAEQQATREQRATEQQAARQQRMEELQMRLQDQRLSQQERAALQREMQQNQIDARKEMLQMAASLRPPRQEDAPVAVLGEDGKPVLVNRRDAIGRAPAPPERAEKPMTEFQGKAALYGTRAAQSHNIMKDLEETISTTGLATKRALQNVPIIGGTLGAAGNLALSKDQQKVEQSQRDFVNAVLRQESGAVISDAEFANAQKQYFPMPGDSKEVIAQKRSNRELAIKGFERMAGREGAAAIDDIRQNTPLRGAERRVTTAPQGIEQKVWDAMTEQERALWRK